MVTLKWCNFSNLKLGQKAGVFSIGAAKGIFFSTQSSHIACQILKDSGKVAMVGVFLFIPFMLLLFQPNWALISSWLSLTTSKSSQVEMRVISEVRTGTYMSVGGLTPPPLVCIPLGHCRNMDPFAIPQIIVILSSHDLSSEC